jgi:hypothetical protein
LWLIKAVCAGPAPQHKSLVYRSLLFFSGSCIFVRMNRLLPWEALLMVAGPAGNFPHALLLS